VRAAEASGGIHPGTVREILVVRPHNQTGDMLLSTPLFTALRRGFEAARITLVASPENWEVMVAHPDVDEVLVLDKRRFRKHPVRPYEFWKALRRTPWDLVLMPTTVSYSVTSALVAALAGGRVRVGCDGRAYGRTMGRAVFSVQVPCRWSGEHQTDRNLDFARALGLAIPTRAPSMGLRAEETSWAAARVAAWREQGRRLVGIHPGAGKLANRWPVRRFAAVGLALAEDPLNQVFVMVGPRETTLGHAMRDFLGDRAVHLSGLSLREAAALIGQFDAFLCNDTGVMHMAAALGTPSVALFGPTDPNLWAPLSPTSHWLRGSGRRVDAIEASDVIARMTELLAADGSNPEADYASEPTSV